MATLAQLQEQLKQNTFKRTILANTIEYLESSFLAKHGGKPEKVMLTLDQVRVPEEAVESVLKELVAILDQADAEIEKVLATDYVVAPPPAEPQEIPPEAPQGA